MMGITALSDVQRMRHPPDSVRFNEPCRHGTSGGYFEAITPIWVLIFLGIGASVEIEDGDIEGNIQDDFSGDIKTR